MAIEIVKPSVGLSKVAVSETHGEDSPYFAGWKAYDENPYHETSNPSGVIQMGLAENQVSFHRLMIQEVVAVGWNFRNEFLSSTFRLLIWWVPHMRRLA